MNVPCPICGNPLAPKYRRLELHHCRSCDVMVRSPMPTDERLSEIYTSDYYKSWDEGGAGCRYWNLKRNLFKTLLSLASAAVPGTKALDIGCATGACLSVMIDLKYEAHGLDVNPYAVEQARNRVPNARVSIGNIETSTFEGEAFGLVVMSDVLEHVREPDSMMSIVSNLLSPGGLIVILTPDTGAFSRHALGSLWPHFKEEHLVLFSKPSLSALIGRHGLETVHLSSFRKPLTFAYAAAQMKTYPMQVVSPVTTFARRLMPRALAEMLFFLPMGEMVAVARRPG